MKALISCHEVAELMGLRVSTIWARCQRRAMHPAPISYQRPYLFSAAKVQRVLDGTEPAPAIYPRPNRRKRGTHVAA